jgi:low affinity Fe/Cu permease
MVKKLILFIFLFTSLFVNAQEPQMADSFRAEGQIYVVIGVMVTIFICVVAYLIIIDRKVKKLEDELKNKK